MTEDQEFIEPTEEELEKYYEEKTEQYWERKKPDYLVEFDNIINKCRKLYKGKESDIGSWIYRQPRNNSTYDLNRVANECLWRIEKGISIKRMDI